MNQSLFLVGEIGGNDYNVPLLAGVPLDDVIPFAPVVIAKISSTITVSTSFTCCARRFRWHLYTDSARKYYPNEC